ncbi:MAG: DUF1080 domain-containing protein [Acidobacteria bacterium]|nr:DUF1080 domain-containing protein [Acidobacteriota bacterium]
MLALPICAADKPAKPGKWVKMFNGKNLDGWKANENPQAWTVVKEDGKAAIKTSGFRSHLFWMTEECENCEFKADFKVMDGSNSGMYFRTAFGPGFPKGYEAQVNATHRDPVKTGSLYNFHKNLESPTKPGQWGTQWIIAEGNHIIIKSVVNGVEKVITDFVDEKNTFTKGYLALQGHDPNSTTYYRNLMFRKLPAKK